MIQFNIKKKIHIIILAIFILPKFVNAQSDSSMMVFSNMVFDTIKIICNKDNGKLWGENLYYPLMIINNGTRTFIANENSNANDLQQIGKIFIGKFPENKIISNSTTVISDKIWTMVAYRDNLELNAQYLKVVLHELFHFYQINNNLTSYGYDNSHMDELEARVYLKLEWNALDEAMCANTEISKQQCIKDALLFRNYRRSLFCDIDSMESIFEIHEGLAEYTSCKLYFENDGEIVNELKSLKKEFYERESFVRTFGYLSGFFYAYFLDKTSLNWRNELKYNDNLGEMLQKALSLEFNMKNITNEVIQRRVKYGYERILKFEKNRHLKTESLKKDWIKKFIIKPTLRIELENPSYGFNPNEVQPLYTFGTIYHVIEITDLFGKLVVSNSEGCMLSQGKAYVSCRNLKINKNMIKGVNWILTLNNGYYLDKENKNYVIKKIIPQSK